MVPSNLHCPSSAGAGAGEASDSVPRRVTLQDLAADLPAPIHETKDSPLGQASKGGVAGVAPLVAPVMLVLFLCANACVIVFPFFTYVPSSGAMTADLPKVSCLEPIGLPFLQAQACLQVSLAKWTKGVHEHTKLPAHRAC